MGRAGNLLFANSECFNICLKMRQVQHYTIHTRRYLLSTQS